MKFEIDIPDEKVQYFSQEAKTELKEQSNRLAKEITDEACRIEDGRRQPSTHSEVTQSDVRIAAKQSRTFVPRREIIMFKIIQAVAFVSTLIAGYLFDTSKFIETKYVVLFVVVLFVAFGTTVYLIFNKENNG